MSYGVNLPLDTHVNDTLVARPFRFRLTTARHGWEFDEEGARRHTFQCYSQFVIHL